MTEKDFMLSVCVAQMKANNSVEFGKQKVGINPPNSQAYTREQDMFA